MFKLLLSELKYHKILLFISFGIAISANIIFTAYDIWVKVLIENKFSKMYWGIFVLYYSVIALSGFQANKMNKKKILPVHKILPLSNYQISLVRILFTTLQWILMLIVVTFFYTLNTHKILTSEWINITGFMSVLYFWYLSLYILNTDMAVLTFKLKEKYLISFFRILIYGFFFFLNYELIAKINFDFGNVSAIIKQIVHNYLLSRSGIELNLVIGAVLLIASIFTFNKRKSFF